jgi:LPXTG-motif cell wall-anchored protein
LRRLLPSTGRLLAGLGAIVAGLAFATVNASPAGATETLPDIHLNEGCMTQENAEYLFTLKIEDGVATGAIMVKDKPLCAGVKQDFTLVSYITPGKQFSVPQYVFDSKTVTLKGEATQNKQVSNRSTDEKATVVTIDVPACYTQVDFVFGSEVINPLTDDSDRYGSRKLGESAAPGSRAKNVQLDKSYLDKGWYNGGENRCKTKPKAEFKSSCDGTTDVWLANGEKANIKAHFFISGAGGFGAGVSLEPGQQQVTKVPASAASKIEIKLNGDIIDTYSWKRPLGCVKPAATYTLDCDNLTVSETNPADGDAIDVTVKTNKPGDQPKTIALKPGAPFDAVFPVSAGLEVTLTNSIKGKTLNAFTFKGDKPTNCGGSGGGGGLPVTGENTGMMVGAAGGLLAVGAGLFVLARRRRIKFTV